VPPSVTDASCDLRPSDLVCSHSVPIMEGMATHQVESNAPESSELPVDPRRVLESVVSELEYLLESTPGIGHDLVELHGALLVYNLGGRVDLIPAATFGVSVRQWHERRVVRSARRLAARAGHDAAETRAYAANVIDRHLHLIDPELRSSAA